MLTSHALALDLRSLESRIHREFGEIGELDFLPDLPDLPVHSDDRFKRAAGLEPARGWRSEVVGKRTAQPLDGRMRGILCGGVGESGFEIERLLADTRETHHASEPRQPMQLLTARSERLAASRGGPFHSRADVFKRCNQPRPRQAERCLGVVWLVRVGRVSHCCDQAVAAVAPSCDVAAGVSFGPCCDPADAGGQAATTAASCAAIIAVTACVASSDSRP